MKSSSVNSFVFPRQPVLEIEAAPNMTPMVDLRHAAYYRDNTGYEVLRRALLQKVSELQKELAAMSDK